MTIYTTVFTLKGTKIARIQDDGYSLYEYFTGYDSVGSANWTKDGDEILLMDLEEAEQIVEDLEAAEAAKTPA